MTNSVDVSPIRYVPCPTCQKPVAWTAANPFRPFCSERCKKIDLGAWAAGDYVIPGKPDIDIDDELV